VLGLNSEPRKAVAEVGTRLGPAAEREMKEVFCHNKFDVDHSGGVDTIDHGYVTSFFLQENADKSKFAAFRKLIEECYKPMTLGPPIRVGDAHEKGAHTCVDLYYRAPHADSGETSYSMCMADTQEGWRISSTFQNAVGAERLGASS
jgi:hypothetical protein